MERAAGFMFTTKEARDTRKETSPDVDGHGKNNEKETKVTADADAKTADLTATTAEPIGISIYLNKEPVNPELKAEPGTATIIVRTPAQAEHAAAKDGEKMEENTHVVELIAISMPPSTEEARGIIIIDFLFNFIGIPSDAPSLQERFETTARKQGREDLNAQEERRRMRRGPMSTCRRCSLALTSPLRCA